MIDGDEENGVGELHGEKGSERERQGMLEGTAKTKGYLRNLIQ